MNPSLDSVLKEMQKVFHSFQLSKIKHFIFKNQGQGIISSSSCGIPEDKTSRLYLIMSTSERLTIS